MILRTRVLLGVCPHQGYRSAAPLETTVELVPGRVNRVVLVSLCAETIKRVFEGDKI